jgi:hypothetical protein
MFALDWLTGFRGKDLNNFPIGSYVKTMPTDGSHFVCSVILFFFRQLCYLSSSDLRLLFAYLASPNISYKLHVYQTEGGVRQAGVKTMPTDGSHFGPRSGSLNTILEVDHLRTIDDMFAILGYWFQRRRF